MKQLAIYVLTYNRPEFVSEAISSILNQTFKDYDLIISDNSTNDDTMRAISTIVAQNNITYIQRSPSLPALEHFNKILSEVGDYEYLMLFHDDDILQQEAVGKIMAALTANQELSAAGCNSLVLKENKITSKPFDPNLISNKLVKNSYDLLNHYLTKKLSHIPFPFYIYRTEKIKGLMLNPSNGGKHADVSFLANSADRGPLLWIAEPLATYRQHTGNDSASINLSAVFSLSKYIIKKHPTLFMKASNYYIKMTLLKLISLLSSKKILQNILFLTISILFILLFTFLFLFTSDLFEIKHGSFRIEKIIKSNGFSDVTINAHSPITATENQKITMESTPVLYKNNLYAIISVRPASLLNGETEIRIDKFTLNQRIKMSQFKIPDFGLISAFVNDEQIYIFGTTNWNSRNEIKMTSSADMQNWTKPVTVFKAQPNQIIFNTSVTKTPNGFALAYEVSEPEIQGFAPRFAVSNDLKSWNKIDDIFKNDMVANTSLTPYSACPTIRFINGKYYMMYLAIRGNLFITQLARSDDLKTWEYADSPVFIPLKSEGINNSDVDFVEYNDKVYFLYHTGDQKTWGQLNLAYYDGNLEKLFGEFKFYSARFLRFISMKNKFLKFIQL